MSEKALTRDDIVRMLRDDLANGEDTEATLQTAMHYGIANDEESLAELIEEASREEPDRNSNSQ